MTAAADEQHYRGAMRRIYRNLIAASFAGVIGAAAWQGWTAAAGFAVGAGASALSFRWLHRFVDAMGPGPQERSKARLAWLLGFRYLVFGLAAYAIVKYFGINAAAIVAGLFVVAAAVLAEILFELVYGT